jgi:3-hydroxyisobutyrate dehydrogenase
MLGFLATREACRMARIGFIGLGKMGLGMAGRLLAAGHRLSIYNRTPSKAASLARTGAVLCDTPAAASRNVEAVISMVADDAASRDVWLGPEGILAGVAEPGVFAIECSTVSYDWVQELASQVRARGLRYIDAPVTGLPDTAADGELTLLVGADAADLEGARGFLRPFSKRVIHFGGVGTGTAYKLIINMLGAVQIASAAETMALAERAGLDLRVVAEAIATGQAASPQVIRNTRRMVDADHNRNVTFTPRLRLKDVDYALRLAGKLGLGAPFGALAAQAFGELCNTGRGEENESNVITVARAAKP